MNTTQTPVVSAITLAFGNACTKGQLNFACAIALEVAEKVLAADSKFKFSAYARTVEHESNGSITEKTVKNVGVVAKAFILKFAAHIATLGKDESDVLLFAKYVEEQVAPTTYKLTLDDLAAFCAGQPSLADKKAQLLTAAIAAEEARKAKQDEAQAEEKSTVDAQLEVAEKTAADAVAAQQKAEEEAATAAAAAAAAETAKKEAEQRGKELAEANQKQAAEAQAELERIQAAAAQAEADRKIAESFAIKVMVDAQGKPVIVVDKDISPEFLAAVAKELQAMSKAKKATIQTAMGQAFAKAA